MRPPGPSVKPALIVMAVAAVILGLGGLAAILVKNPPNETATQPPRTSVVAGLSGEPAGALLSPIRSADEPPVDIVGALVVPKESLLIPQSAIDRGVGLYDRSLRLQTAGTQAQVISFFRAELASFRWQVISQGPSSSTQQGTSGPANQPTGEPSATAAGAYQILARHPGSDGYEWEIGLGISATSFSSAVPNVTAPPTGVTEVTLRLFAQGSA